MILSPRRRKSRALRCVLVVILLGLQGLPGCGRQRRPNVLLVTLDTTRTDRIGCYGAADARTPWIDGVAGEGIRFERAFCQAPVTRPSHASMLTSQYPRTHGVMRNGDDLPPGPRLLSELLQTNGYDTGAFTGVALLSPEAGFARGFDRFDSPSQGRSRPGGETVRRAIAWLGDRDRSAPFFLWVHLFDAHFPYHWEEGQPPLGAYDGPIREGNWKEIELAAGDSGLSPRDRDRLLAMYAAEVRSCDTWSGRLFQALKEMGEWEKTEVFILSDHGEGFENGVFLEHQTSIYRSVTGIVFIWKRSGPSSAGTVCRAPVETVDLLPTVAAILGIEPGKDVEGSSLLPLLERDAAPPAPAIVEEPSVGERLAGTIRARNAIADGPRFGEKLRDPRTGGERIAAQDGEWTYIFDSGGNEELYEANSDPSEKVNRMADGPRPVIDRLRRAVLEWRRLHPAPPSLNEEELSDETRALLEELGYL